MMLFFYPLTLILSFAPMMIFRILIFFEYDFGENEEFYFGTAGVCLVMLGGFFDTMVYVFFVLNNNAPKIASP